MEHISSKSQSQFNHMLLVLQLENQWTFCHINSFCLILISEDNVTFFKSSLREESELMKIAKVMELCIVTFGL